MKSKFFSHTYFFLLQLLLLCWISTSFCKPILVTFGTNQGSITPYVPKPTTPPPKNVVARSPAPIFEATDDIPNPIVYKPLIPHQYRSKLYSFQPNTNLLLGTPLDIKYTPILNKYQIYKKQLAKSLGREYTGPQYFERQPYEDDLKKLPQVDGSKFQQNQQQTVKQGYVPEIGVVYSSGVRYYVPQLVFYTQNEDAENSVYDKNDVKHVQLQN